MSDGIQAGSLNLAIELRCAIAKAMQASTFSRAAIAARMTDYLGVEVSEAQLDAWSAPSRTRWRFPFEYAAAFDAACGGIALMELLAHKRQHRLLAPSELRDAELGRIGRELAALRDRQAALLAAASLDEVAR